MPEVFSQTHCDNLFTVEGGADDVNRQLFLHHYLPSHLASALVALNEFALPIGAEKLFIFAS